MTKLSNMILDINNFGPILNARIELKKLNVIAGINGSGKTTSSKLLYCFLTSTSDEKDYLANLSIYERFIKIRSSLDLEVEFDLETSDKLRNLYDKFPKLTDMEYNTKLKKHIAPLKKIINDSQISNKENFIKKLTTLESVLEINNVDHRKFFDVSNTLLESEFRISDLKLNNPDVTFHGKQDDCNFLYKLDFDESKWGFKIDEGDSNCFNINNIIYIDSPSIFNSTAVENSIILKKQPYHLRSLSQALYSPKNTDDVYDDLFNQKLEEFSKKISLLIGGYIYFDDDNREFKFKKDDDNYSMNDTASGVKQLGILQMLLSNRVLNENSFIIMDEPEVNIHPEWQVKFAEILALLIKELNISVFINSHSPQFIEALEVYSANHDLVDETQFYLSCEKEDGKFDFEEIDRDDLVILYNNLGDPYDTINKVRADNMKRGIF